MYTLSFTFIWDEKFSYSRETIVASIENAANHVVDREKANFIDNKKNKGILIFTVNLVSAKLRSSILKRNLISILGNHNINDIQIIISTDEYSWWKKHTKGITLFFGLMSVSSFIIGLIQFFV